MWVGGCLASYKGRFGDSGPGMPGLPQSVLDWGLPHCEILSLCVAFYESVTSWPFLEGTQPRYQHQSYHRQMVEPVHEQD